ncbi:MULTISPECIES: nicotinate-nucleotide--dimethylbenzimidazole phosphoribosyltransferase [unclassified Streptomyces]|uniref:nicotinate-nucleotide--dimethylbenzimidazole phosphoribosyltransferase n=1 Tax=unclassified Streptomyces TaxID=2593676 RepID=UPI002E80D5B8|nr:nicotinate-nucleotide--dimethylbenzimidazole phosphoribosyltransferase [Streptomyces sp. NBC_00589]WTI40647.1 nicotinate-nucleotide--dimethylbenzimidazole phosphoribosyltransferase [Streptomyces sp. NBC_00775]WUB25669.1 nicotinate-nucleotide--dimethylbenzimidazole phosphoribosyltransferase [Streptomyces sp. NBC_00589]
MTDTGQVPGEGLPENAGMVEQPGVTAPGAYTFLDPSENPVEDDDLLLMPGAPGAQGAWGNEVPPPAPMPFLHEPGPHEMAGRDSGAVDLGAVRAPNLAPAPQPTTPRRPLHLGPPTPDGSASPVRSLADRGPAGAPVSPAPVTPSPVADPVIAAPVTPVRHAGPPTVGPEYLDVPQLGEIPPQGAVPWGVPPVASDAGVAETVVPEPGPALESLTPAEAAPVAEAAQPAEAPGLAPAPQAQAQVAEAAAEPQALQVAEGSPAPQEPAGAQAPETAPVLDGSQVPQTPDATPFPAAPEVPHAFQATDDTDGNGHAAHADGAHASAHEAAPAQILPDVEHVAPAQNLAPVPDLAPAHAPQAGHAAPPHFAEQGAYGVDPAEPAAQFTDPGVHIPEPAAQFADAGSVGFHGEAPQPLATAVASAPEVAQAALSADASHGQSVPGLEAFQAQQFAAPAAFAENGSAEALHGIPVSVAAHAEAPQASADWRHGEQHFPDAVGATGASGLPGTPLEPHADQPLGEFVPVEGLVPTTPHLAPTPPHAMIVPPLPSEEQPVAEEPADETIVVAPAPTQEIAGEPVEAITEETVEESPETPAAETEPIAPAVVPAPREAEAEAEAEPQVETRPEVLPVPEPFAAEPEPVVVAQQAEDLDTQVADQEESTAVVEDVRESTGPAAPGYDDAEREAVLRVMRERRDIRNGFRSDPIPHDVLLRVLEAAHTAPSVGHSQPWDFVVIRSADTRRSMHELAARQREAYAKSLPKGRAKQFKELKIEAILDTPVNIVVTADPTRGGRHTLGRHTQPQMAPYSSALAVENLWLAARAEGLGVGWVSFFDEREMVRALGLPEHLEVVAYLCVGYVDEFPDEPELMQAGWSKRRPLSWVVHEETYGRRALPGEEPHDLLAETVSNIRPLDAKALGEAWERQKRMTKPAGALGMLEIISAQLSGLSRMCPPPIPEPAAVAIFAGDHGVHAQGVTPWPQEVTAQMVANFLGGGAVCNAFANQVGAEVCVIDVGVASDLPATPGLLPRKVRAGTADMTTGPAMSREEVIAAIEVGIETARDLVAAGNKALLTGEMGIANTTASAALISVFTDTDPSEVTGRGTGINDETLARKTEVVRRAIELHQPDPADPIGALAAIGGLEHAAMVGLLLGGASLRTPVILDGVSAGAAALVARAIAPEVLAACIAGHRSAEPGHVAALNKLGLRPLVDLDLRLGEGTGALLALPVVQSAARAMHEVATFDSAGVTEK